MDNYYIDQIIYRLENFAGLFDGRGQSLPHQSTAIFIFILGIEV